MPERVAGRLLVASPLLADPNFARTVILILEHGDEGALGLVLNRASSTTVAETLPQWAASAALPPVVFVGGPVEPQAAICLARVRADGDPAGWKRLSGPLGVLDLGADPEWLTDAVTALRVFAGYAGWGGGQLDAEIAAGGWYAVPASPDDVFTTDPDGLWAAVLRRQRGSLRLLASFPPDPRLN